MATSASVAGLDTEIRERLGDAVTDIAENRGQLIIRASASRRVEILQGLKDLGFTFYSFCSAVDWPDDNRFEVLDHVYCISRRARVTVKYDVPRDNPRLPTATPVYGGANWHERETWELFGVHFEGHPHLARLLLPDWFEGYPMRKDYVLPARVEKPWPGEFFEG